MIYGDLSCSRIFFDCKSSVKAETKTYKVQKPVPNTSADLCTLSVSIWFQFQFLYIFRYLVFKSLQQTNGINSLILFLSAIQIVDLKSS